MATITKPMALDETLHTTESTPRRQADVLAGIQQAIREGFGQVASGIEYDNTTSGLTSDNVQGAIDEVDAALDVVEDDIESTQEVSGNPLTLTDAAPINAEKLEVVLEPKQDLHGQSYPYVGGAGVNKMPCPKAGTTEVINGITWKVNNDGSITVNGTASAESVFYFIDGDTVTLNGAYKGSLFNGSDLTDMASGFRVGTTWNDFRNYAVTVNGILNQVWFKVNNGRTVNKTIYPMIFESAQSPTSFSPYSNICPISGYDEVEVDDVGANQWDEEWEVGGLNEANGSETSNSSYIRSGFIPLSGGMSIYGYSRVSSQLVAYFYTSDKGYIGFKVITNISYTVPSNTAFCRIRIEVDITNYTKGDISINYPSTFTDYVPYKSATTSITFGQTVYGGKSDFVEGGTKVTRYYKKNLKDLNWEADTDYSNNAFYASSWTLPIPKNSGSSTVTNILCDRYKADTVYRIDRGLTDGAICEVQYSSGTGTRIWVCDKRYDNVTDFKNSLEDCEICYEVATPTIITTPIAPLKLLDGINNISTNGTIINLGYQQNNVVGELKGEIEQAFYNHSMIYNIQSESTAVNMAYTDDFKAIGFDIPFIQEQHDNSTTPPTNWNIDLSACDIAVNGFLPLYEDAQTGILVESSKLIASIEQVQKKDDCFRVFVGFYNLKMTSSADDITNAIIILDITAFGKVLDSRTLRN